MDKIRNALVVAEAVLALLLMLGVLTQTPKASGLGGTIGGGGDGLGGGYRARHGPERQIYWTTGGLVGGFLVCSIAHVWGGAHPTPEPPPRRLRGGPGPPWGPARRPRGRNARRA